MSALDRQLQQAGLTNMQARMYIALLQLGQASASQLARLAKINRVTAYTTLNELEALNLVLSDDMELVRTYTPQPPENLEKIFMMRAKDAIASYRQVQSLLPDLAHVGRKTIAVPTTHYVEGKHAIQKYLTSVSQKHHLKGAYISHESHYDVLKPFAKRASEDQTRVLAIIPNVIKAQLLVYIDHRVVPSKIAHFPSTMLCFEDLSITLFQDEQFLQLFAIEDTRVATHMLHVFQLNWRILSGQHLLVPTSE